MKRIRALRETDPEVDDLLTILTNELRDRAPRKRKPTTQPDRLSPARTVGPLVDEGVLDALSERIADREVSKLTAPQVVATAPAADLAAREGRCLPTSTFRSHSAMPVPVGIAYRVAVDKIPWIPEMRNLQ